MGARKAAAYILRVRDGERELLVFRHRDYAEAGVQVPAGTIDGDESPEVALWREVLEESGLSAWDGLRLVRKLGVHHFTWADSGHPGERHFYVMEMPVDVADAWTHRVHGGGLDDGLAFCYEWVRFPPEEGGVELAGDLGWGLAKV